MSSKNPVPILAVGQTDVAGSAIYPQALETPSEDVSTCKHLSTVKDSFTGYPAPTGMEVDWSGERRDGQGKASAKLVVDKLGAVEGEGGLIEKVDVLAEIPYVIKKALSAVTGTKPYIYQVRIMFTYKQRWRLISSISTQLRWKWRLMGRTFR